MCCVLGLRPPPPSMVRGPRPRPHEAECPPVSLAASPWNYSMFALVAVVLLTGGFLLRRSILANR